MAEPSEELADLKQRVVALEELAEGMTNLLKAYARSRPRSADLFPRAVNGTHGSELGALRDALLSTYTRVTGKKYVFDGAKDMQAVKKLAALQPGLHGEMHARWEECLRMTRYPGTQSLAQFVSRINSFGRRESLPSAVLPVDPYGP